MKRLVSATLLKHYVGDGNIYDHYFTKDWAIGPKMHSPFRFDPKPSLAMYTYEKTGDIWWTDFGAEDTPLVRDSIGFVQYMWEQSRQDAINQIWQEMVLDKDVKIPHRKIVDVKPMRLEPLLKPYTEEWEWSYWKTLKFDLDYLNYLGIKCAKKLKRLDLTIWESTKDDPIFFYDFGERRGKAYRPLSKGERFRGIDNMEVLEGWNLLPDTCDDVILGSSFKDTATVGYLGYAGFNPSSENSYKFLLTKVDEINKRFKRVWILFDNDKAGREAAKNLNELTGWNIINLPTDVKCPETGKIAKDPSDFVTFTGNYLYLSKFLSNFEITKCSTYDRQRS